MIKKYKHRRKYFIKKKYKTKKISILKFKHSLFIKLFELLFFVFIFILEIFIYNTYNDNNKTKICLCSIAKKENLYIKFFVEHYKNLGYNHIYLYDNNDINDEKIENVIKDYINKGYVTLIDYRGYRGKRNSPQMDAFYDCYEKNNKNYDWLSFFDLDEYLVLKPEGIKIQDFLNNERYHNCSNIKFNWMVFNDNDQTHYVNKSFIERFTKRSKWLHSVHIIKSTIRGNLPLYNLKRSYNPHSIYYNINCCTSSGKKAGQSYYNYPPDYEYGELRHYTKTMGEYVDKIKRGRATTTLIKNTNTLRGYYNHFFDHCKKTPEKVKIFNSAFNTNFK